MKELDGILCLLIGNRILFCLLGSNDCTDSATAFKYLQFCRDWWECLIIIKYFLPFYCASLNQYCNKEFEITHWICLFFSQWYNFRWDKQIIRIHHCSWKSLFMSLSFFKGARSAARWKYEEKKYTFIPKEIFRWIAP